MKHSEYQIGKTRKENFHSPHIIVKTPSIQNKERVLKTAREKTKITYKGNSSE